VDYESSEEEISTDLMTPKDPLPKKKSKSKPKKSSTVKKSATKKNRETKPRKSSNDKDNEYIPDSASNEDSTTHLEGALEPRRSLRLRNVSKRKTRR